jgi:polysaccharide biosynthesis protein PelF
MNRRLRVCLVSEGSYPFITGGVSAWMHDLIRGLPEIDFVLYTISPKEDQEMHYTLPENVVENKDLVVWKRYESSRHPHSVHQVMKTVEKFHRGMFADAPDNANELLSMLPEEYFLHRDAVRNEIGCNLIAFGNETKNPLYPFSDYF